jgi:hypothetical protein
MGKMPLASQLLDSEVFALFWHQRLGQMHSRRVSDSTYATGTQLAHATEIDD